MKQRMKGFIGLFLALCLVIAMIPAAAIAAPGDNSTLTWTANNTSTSLGIDCDASAVTFAITKVGNNNLSVSSQGNSSSITAGNGQNKNTYRWQLVITSGSDTKYTSSYITSSLSTTYEVASLGVGTYTATANLYAKSGNSWSNSASVTGSITIIVSHKGYEVSEWSWTDAADENTAPTCTATIKCTNSSCSFSTTANDCTVSELTDKYEAATCTVDGKKVYSASVTYNGTTYTTAEANCETVTLKALGHTEVTDAAVAPTCTESGLTKGSHCSVCNAEIVAQKTVAAKGHTVVVDEAVAATAEEPGWTEGSHCSECGKVIEAQEEVTYTLGTESNSDVNANVVFPDDLEELLTEEELELLGAGTAIYFNVDVDEYTEVPTEDQTAITEKAADLGNLVYTYYMDITVSKTVGDETTEITELASAITITLEIPEEMLAYTEGLEGTYTVIRLHDGVAEELKTTYDSEEQTVTFSTDKFSTYAITFTTAEVEETEPESNAETTSEVATGDAAYLFLWMLMALEAVLVLGLVARKRQRSGK